MQSLPTAQLGRPVPTDAQMDALVSAELARQCSAQAVFTATDIKNAIRQANPGLEIDHARVRDRVHGAMGNIPLGTGLYTRATEFVPQAGTTAIVYRPVAAPPAASTPAPQVRAAAPTPSGQAVFGPATLLLPSPE